MGGQEIADFCPTYTSVSSLLHENCSITDIPLSILLYRISGSHLLMAQLLVLTVLILKTNLQVS